MRTIALVVAVLAIASPASAQDSSSAGAWVAGRTETTDTKITQCAMETEQQGRMLRFLKFSDDARYYVHVFGPGLSVAERSQHTLAASFDGGGQPLTLNAIGARGNDGGLLASLSAADFEVLLTQVGASNRLQLRFPTVAGAAESSLSLGGTGAMARVFRRCVSGL